MKKEWIIKGVIFLVVLLLCVTSSIQLLWMHKDAEIVVSENVTEIKHLSDWNPALKGTNGDSKVYVLRGEEEGASFLLLGGTHESEISSSMNCITYIENADVQKGTLYIIPYANNSAITHTAPLSGMLDRFTLTLTDGSTRSFRIGNRYTNPVDQWPDPNYFMGSSGRELTNGSVAEIRNLNRNYPANGAGEDSGYLTLRACYAIYNLINTEEIDFLYDAHEGNIAFPRVDYMIAHNDAMTLASTASINMMLENLTLGVDLSGTNSWGLSHRALGDNTDALCTLVEAISPLGAMSGKKNYDLIINGQDDILLSDTAAEYANAAGGKPATDTSAKLDYRTAYHCAVTKALIDAYTEMYPDNAIVVDGIPSHHEFVEVGLAGLLKPLA